ncbi:VOC family protein [Streptomyces phyllanthi]|uniref:VOC family protein n=1 Tax=Streptomyces phyllanthi TaxID=1803180 RepID=A0A5N8W853_9ACTN|nr:VOC family protein [Streptomyces phyllanthi]MPY43663.1 VOC family protein [Streptomyces phyllanthi]
MNGSPTGTGPTAGTGLERLHHSATPVADQEVNRHFIEDLIGLPLTATWCEESVTTPGMTFCHTFYELDDGGALAFFQMSAPHDHEFLLGPTNRYNHVALRADTATLDAVHQRLVAAAYPHFIQDHGYVKSLYVTSPDGLELEIAVDPPNVEEIREKRMSDARSELARWLAGDHRTNNDWRPEHHSVIHYPAHRAAADA